MSLDDRDWYREEMAKKLKAIENYEENKHKKEIRGYHIKYENKKDKFDIKWGIVIVLLVILFVVFYNIFSF
jgi:hypothetical protein